MSDEVAAEKPTVLVIAGPTAAGKTECALALAEYLPIEVISGDSMLAYRGMDIGTAKPSPEERERVPHHLIDLIEPDEPFNVADYAPLAMAAVHDIHSRGRLPCIVGGSGLYIRSVTCCLDLPVASPDQSMRARLEEEARVLGRAHLHERLRSVDPAAAARIHENDLKRVVRALEVYEKTGRPMSDVYREAPEPTNELYCLVYVLSRDREGLYQRIERRCDAMVHRGLIGEVRALLGRGYGPGLQSMQAIGYKEVAAHILGEYDFAEMMAVFKRNSRRFAKRQLTWFSKEPGACWIDADAVEPVEALLTDIRRRTPAAV